MSRLICGLTSEQTAYFVGDAAEVDFRLNSVDYLLYNIVGKVNAEDFLYCLDSSVLNFCAKLGSAFTFATTSSIFALISIVLPPYNGFVLGGTAHI